MKYVVKALKTSLKVPLTAAATSVVLRKLQDTKGNNIELADFGDWFVVVVKQGDTIEMIKCDAISTDPDDDTATCTVDTNGRNIDCTTPYAGYSTGENFQSGAEVIITNDPLSMSQFANLNLANTWALLQIFTTATRPQLTSDQDATDDKELITRGELLRTSLAGANLNANLHTVTAGEALAIGNHVYFKESDQRWWKTDVDDPATSINVKLGIVQTTASGAGVSFTILTSGLDQTQSGLTPGAKYYLSATAGGLSATLEPLSRFVGWALSATKLFFQPDAIEDEIEAVVSGEALTVGTLAYFKESDQQWWKTDADVKATSVGVKTGIVQTASTGSTQIILVRVSGVDQTQSGMTPGAKYYVSNTAGLITASAPTFPRLIGYALSAKRLLLVPFDPSGVDVYGQATYGVTASGNDTYAVSLPFALVGYYAGLHAFIKVDVACSGASSANLNGLGAVAIKVHGTLDTITGDILAGQVIELIHDGTYFQLISNVRTQFAGGFIAGGGNIGAGRNDVITHGLNRIPKRISLTVHNVSTAGGGGSSVSDGVAIISDAGSIVSQGYSVKSIVSTTAINGNTGAIGAGTGNGDTHVCTLTAVDATTFTINWPGSANVNGTPNYIYRVEY